MISYKLFNEHGDEVQKTNCLNELKAAENRATDHDREFTCYGPELVTIVVFNDDRRIGSIGAMLHSYNGTIINNITGASILPEYRGKGIGKELFARALDLGDMVLDLSPTESVYMMLLTKLGGWSAYFDYQIWVNCARLKAAVVEEHTTDTDEIIKMVPATQRQIIEDHRTYSNRFVLFSFGEENLLVSYQTVYSIPLFQSYEVIYVSDPSLFDRHFDSVVKTISYLTGVPFIFVDSCFFDKDHFEGELVESCAGSRVKKIKRILKMQFVKYLKVPSRRILLNKTGKPTDFVQRKGYLYTEIIMK